jgi:translation initiation factor 3 subunit J
LQESESGSEEEEVKPTTTAKPIAKPVRHKWEDEEEEAPVGQMVRTLISLASKTYLQDEWDASADEDEKPKPVASNATAPKKKGTLKQKIAEKEAQKAARIAAGLEDDDDDEEGSVVNDAEQRRRDKEREVMADLNNATSLLGAAALGGMVVV